MAPVCFRTLDTFTGAGMSNLRNLGCPVKKCLLRLDLDLSLQREANKSEIRKGTQFCPLQCPWEESSLINLEAI